MEIFVYGKNYAGRRVQMAFIYELVKEKPMTAYELLKKLREMGIRTSPSSLYELLRQMEKAGMIVKRGETYEPGDFEPDPEALKGVSLLKALASEPYRELLEALLELAESCGNRAPPKALKDIASELKELASRCPSYNLS